MKAREPNGLDGHAEVQEVADVPPYRAFVDYERAIGVPASWSNENFTELRTASAVIEKFAR